MPPHSPHRKSEPDRSAGGEAITDIAILGAGPTGLALACALADSPFRITLIDADRADRAAADPRALALSEGTCQVLRRLGVWTGSVAAATPIRHIHISQQGGHGQSTLHAEEEGFATLGHVVPYRDLCTVLLERLDALPHNLKENRTGAAPQIDLRWNTRIETHTAMTGEPIGEGRRLRLSDGTTLAARLLVHAEGTQDNEAWEADYAQHAIVCEALPTLPHDSTAHERFTPAGPLALLPLGAAYSVVMIVPAAQRQTLLDLDDAGFATELTTRLGGDRRFSQVSARYAFPLRLRLRSTLARGREVWIGNAAQTLHPVSGQGFNLALRDAWTLADVLLTCQTPSDLRASALVAWAHSRQPDRLGSALFTDGLVRLFSNDFPLLNTARGLGLTLLEKTPPLKHFLARRLIFGARAW